MTIFFLRLSPAVRNGVIVAVFIALLMAVILHHIAITADAYVTFRVVDNFVHGYGLRWNIIDRVQVYTHPLWMLLHIPFYALGINIFYVAVALSVACSLGAVLLTIHTFHKPWLQTVALFLVPLVVSQSFTYSSMNGLENSLEHLLFAFFGWALLRAEAKRFWFWLSFSCSLSLLTRLDTVLLYAPVISYLAVTRFRSLRFGQCLLGALPIIIWECFSLFYYGFPFPNTAYAKLGGGSDAIRQGFHYLLNLLALDITSAEFLFAAAILLPVCRWFAADGKTIRAELVFLSLGVLLYALYVINIGGTYLSGRFWSLPVFASVWLIYATVSDRVGRKFCLCFAAALLLIRLAYPAPAALQKACPLCFAGGIWPDYYSVSPDGYMIGKVHRPLPVGVLYSGAPWVAVFSGVGIFAYETGPSLTAVNPYAFTDPLLARLPGVGIPLTRSVNSHWLRAVPKGYVYALKTGSLEKWTRRWLNITANCG